MIFFIRPNLFSYVDLIYPASWLLAEIKNQLNSLLESVQRIIKQRIDDLLIYAVIHVVLLEFATT